MPLHPTVYGNMLAKKIHESGAKAWLMNTGMTGGKYGVGKRMSIQHTRTLLNAALEGKLDNVPTYTDPVFGLEVPTECPGIPAGVLRPRESWKDPAEYDKTAKELGKMFAENFRQFADQASAEVVAAGPKVG
jgi:phosphoenolpyruvate carboxykinase (ATP)